MSRTRSTIASAAIAMRTERAFLEECHAEIDRLLEGSLGGLTEQELSELAGAASTSALLLLKALC